MDLKGCESLSSTDGSKVWIHAINSQQKGPPHSSSSAWKE